MSEPDGKPQAEEDPLRGGQAAPGKDAPGSHRAPSRPIASKEELKGLARGASPDGYRDRIDRT